MGSSEGKGRLKQGMLVLGAIVVLLVIVGLVASGVETGARPDSNRATGAAKANGTPASNPHGLLDHLGRVMEDPLDEGDKTTITRDSGRKNDKRTYSPLWLSLEDQKDCKENWKNYPGSGEGQKFDNCVNQMLEDGKIIPVGIGETVKILKVRPPKDKKYAFTYFEVQVQTGEYAGQSGWASSFALIN